MGIFDKLFGPSEVEKLLKKRDVEGLIEELQKANYCDAAEALRQIGDKRAVAPLIKALEDHAAKGEVCINLVNALGEFGDERAVTPLAKLLENPGTDGEVCIVIVGALAQIWGERAIEALAKALSDEIRGKKDMIGLMEVSVGMAATHVLRRIGKPAVEPLIKMLESGDVDMAGDAAHALGIITDNRAIEPLIRALGIKDARVAEPSTLVRSLGSKYWRVHDNAAVALQNIGEPAIEPLTRALEDKNKDVCEGAEKILKKIRKK